MMFRPDRAELLGQGWQTYSMHVVACTKEDIFGMSLIEVLNQNLLTLCKILHLIVIFFNNTFDGLENSLYFFMSTNVLVISLNYSLTLPQFCSADAGNSHRENKLFWGKRVGGL